MPISCLIASEGVTIALILVTVAVWSGL